MYILLSVFQRNVKGIYIPLQYVNVNYSSLQNLYVILIFTNLIYRKKWQFFVLG